MIIVHIIPHSYAIISVVKINRQHVLAALRMGKSAPDAALERRLEAVGAEILAAARPLGRWQAADITDASDGSFAVGPLRLASADLRRTLKGCSHAFLFCATLGAGVDAVLRRYGALGATDLLIAQAIASTLIEAYCDECEEKMRAEPIAAGRTLRFRFAPGYGDLPLDVQRPLLETLDAAHRIGLTLTDSLQMIPTKSVSAIIGIG